MAEVATVHSTEATASDLRRPLARGDAGIFLQLYAISLLVSLTFGFLVRFRAKPSLLEADEFEYYYTAMQIVSGNVHLTPRRTLGFPSIEAALHAVWNNFIFMQCVITAIFAFSIPLTYLLVNKVIRDRRLSVVAALAVGLWPAILFYGTSLYSESIALPFFLLGMVLIPVGSKVRQDGLPALGSALLSGLVFALTAQIRPMYLLFLPVILVINFWEERRFKVAAQRFLMILLGFCLLTAPWSLYMTQRFHRLILITSNGGETLAGGLNPELFNLSAERQARFFNRTTWEGPGKWLSPERTGYLSAAELSLPYERQDALLKARTFDWVVKNPGQALYLEFSKFCYLWGMTSPQANGLKQTIFGTIPTLVLLIAAVAVGVFSNRARWQLARFWLLPLFVTGVAMISWGSWRFRQVGDVGLIVFVVVGIAWLFPKLRARWLPEPQPS